MIRRAGGVLLVGLLIGLAISGPARAADGMTPPPFPERLDAIEPPVNVAVRYRDVPARPFTSMLRWGPATTPELYGLAAEGTVAVKMGGDEVSVVVERQATRFLAGPKESLRADKGRTVAVLNPLGPLRRFEVKLPALDTDDHRRQFAEIGAALIDGAAFPAFRRLLVRAGPEDAGGDGQAARERSARADLIEALQPVLGLAVAYPAAGVHTGTRLTVLRRDFGDLFRGAAPIPVTVTGEVKGLAEVDGKRLLALRIDRADAPPPIRFNAAGHALVDIETGLVTALVADLEMVVLKGTEAAVYRFTERRQLGAP